MPWFSGCSREYSITIVNGKDDWANVDIQNLSLFSDNDEASSSTSVYSDDVNNTDVEKENEGQNLNPLKHLRPLRPGAAICPEPLLDFRESTCATLGGFVKKNDNFYALTAAHLFSVHSPCKMSSDGGTFHDNCHVSQSCPFAQTTYSTFILKEMSMDVRCVLNVLMKLHNYVTLFFVCITLLRKDVQLPEI